MRRIVFLALALLPANAFALDYPDGAFPPTNYNAAPIQGDGLLMHVPSSAKTYTKSQIEDGFNPPDWVPKIHPPMPQVVAHGNGTTVQACAFCHLPTGTGDEQSANIAGLPLPYLIEQMHDYKSGARLGSKAMANIARAITRADMWASANYFTSLKPRPWIRVVESATVPKTVVGAGGMRLPNPDGGIEAIGTRIIEIPENPALALDRDPLSGFIDYVPPGSIAKGQAIVSTGDGGKIMPCGTCHGATNTGGDYVPGITGRQATSLVRQLFDMQHGDRAGTPAAMMEVTKILSMDDIVAIAAYLASCPP